MNKEIENTLLTIINHCKNIDDCCRSCQLREFCAMYFNESPGYWEEYLKYVKQKKLNN